jgi:hypothetical protein
VTSSLALSSVVKNVVGATSGTVSLSMSVRLATSRTVCSCSLSLRKMGPGIMSLCSGNTLMICGEEVSSASLTV